mmetsp:Transcript_9163/g.19847  ORF Transcript_9163/g.19847 Transcript_9163/m.19847 type:complete len:137 (+) Transcript_9163:1-411(+)
MMLNGLCNFVAQLLSFAVLCMLTSPVSAAVVSTVKRVVVVAAASIWFGSRVTPVHACGMAAAILGVGLYQAASSRAGKRASPFAKLQGVKVDRVPEEAQPPVKAAAVNGAPPTTRRNASLGAHLAAMDDGWGLTQV